MGITAEILSVFSLFGRILMQISNEACIKTYYIFDKNIFSSESAFSSYHKVLKSQKLFAP